MNARSNAANPTLEAALLYIENGWALVPLAPKCKTPCHELLPINPATGKRGWQPLASSLATARDVESWFRRVPNLNIGVICGQASGGLVVVDFDKTPPTDWHSPLTPRSVTGRGEHVFFRTSEPVPGHCLVHNSQKLGEIRSDGGYVVVPPSVHPSGQAYEWAEQLSPTDLDWDFAPPPAWATAGCKVGSLQRGEGKQVNHIDYLLTPSTHSIDYLLTFWPDELIQAVALILGIEPEKATPDGLGQRFCCVLPGHEEEHPSASLYRHDNGLAIYRDWHRRSGDANYLLPEVYASQAYGVARKLNKPELTTWQLRLLVQTGLVKPAEVRMPPLPSNAKPSVQRVYEGFRLLLQCKWVYEYGAPTAFSWRFASAWCGISERHAGPAIQELLRSQIIRIVGHHRRMGRPMALFLPTDLSLTGSIREPVS